MTKSLHRLSQLSVSWQRLLRASLFHYFVGYKLGTYIGPLLVGGSRDQFPVVSLDFSLTYLLPTVPWPWSRLSPKWRWVPGTFLGVKEAGAWGWQPHHLHVPNVMKSGSLNFLEPSRPHRACYGTTLPYLYRTWSPTFKRIILMIHYDKYTHF